MSDRKQALQDLLAKIEAGERPWREPSDSGCDYAGAILRAFHGSLDAAKALHEAVLPEWEYGVTHNQEQPEGPCAFVAEWGEENGFEACSETPARAWLCAILKALIAQEEGK